MWNPPPPDLQLNLANKYSTGRRDIAPSNRSNNSNLDLTSPKNSLSQDRAYNPERYSDHGGDGPVPNYSSGPHLIPAMNRPTVSSLPHPRLERIAPYLTIATLQAYTVLTVVRCLADPDWIVLEYDDKGEPLVTLSIGQLEKSFLACAIAVTMANCLGVTLRIMDKLPWLRKASVMAAYLEALFCIAAMTSFLSTHSLPAVRQFSHGFLACIITVVFSAIVAVMLTIDWYKGFPSAGLSATLKALIISSFVMTIVIIIGAAIYSSLEKWSFDDAVNFCIVSFATIGYGNLSPKTSAGRIIFFIYGLLGISSLGFFVVSLRNAVIEQFQWRLVDRFSKPAHLTRVQTRMSAKDISFPAARFEEESQVKMMVKRKMILRMVFIWIVMWFGGAGIFCAFEKWTYLESLYFCFVTLTTIGFGDFVPTAPGSIEFWNVYVFVGLAVFAYILSLSSESMASQIHLVDDRDEDDDADMYGWERNEDPNAPLTTRSGILGLEGLIWAQQQQQHPIPIGESDQQDDQELKQNTTRSLPGAAMEYMGMDHDDTSAQSSIQRMRPGRKSSSGKILMVSAKERKQMLQAEYYANASLPTIIRFVDTQGVPHEKVIRRGTSGNVLDSPNENINNAGGYQPGLVYNTVGYYGTVGQGGDGWRRTGSGLRNQQTFRGVGVANHGTMYGAGSNDLNELNEESQLGVVQTDSLRHQPLIKFDSPKGSVRSAGGERSIRPTPTVDKHTPGPGYIPSCRDVFGGQSNDNGEGPSKPSGLGLSVVDSPRTRGRSNSWDGSAAQTVGPSQNEVHRWLAEGAGTLEGPKFAYTMERTTEGLGIDEMYQNDRTRQSHSSDATRVASPPPAGPSGSKEFLKTEAGIEEFAGQPSTLTLDGRRHHRDGIAPDELAFTEEPAAMTDEEMVLSESGQLCAHSLTPVPVPSQPSPPHEFVARIREPTLPREMNPQQQGPFADSRGSLGSGTSAGYPAHAYGGSFSPNSYDTFDNSRSPPHPQHFVLPISTPSSLFDDGLDHQLTIHGSDSRPMSLFSNHYRSGHNSVIGSPVGSRPSSRAPSVLMTIFDEPVSVPSLSRPGSRPGSRSVSRSGSLVGGSLSRTGQMFPRSSGATTGLGIGGVDTGPGSGSGTDPAVHSPDTSVGPFDEVRGAEPRLHFDDDVDLNYVEMSPELVQAEYARREDMKRREREVEAQLAQAGSRHLHLQQQQHGWKGKGREEASGP